MQKTFKRVLAVALACVLLVSMFAISAAAYSPGNSTTHTVFKHTEQTLAPGVTYYNNFAYSSDNKQMAYYVATADLNNPDVVVQTSYRNQYNDGNGMMRVTDQIAYANDFYSDASKSGDRFISEYYNVVAGCNASFFNMSTGQPTGVCILDGQSISASPKSYPCFFMVDNNGVASVHKIADYDACLASGISQAVAGSQLLVWEGVDVTANIGGDYNVDRHSRTCIGVTSDNKVVIMTLDGRQEPFSCGGSMHELAQIMLEADCVAAINLDGGGSSTFATRPEGENSVRVVNRPSDGSERSVSSGIIIASTAAPSDAFDHVSIVPENEYVTPGSTVDLDIAGVSPVGTSAEIPDGITYSATYGNVVNGQFVSDGTVGDAEITATYDGQEVGSAVIHVATPTRVEFATEEMTLSYGKTTELLFTAYCDAVHTLTVKEGDFNLSITNDTVGSFNGYNFTAGTQESATANSAVITITSAYDASVSATTTMNLGQGSVVVYDFEGFDAGTLTAWWTGGDRQEGYVSVVTPETGKVRNGNNALAINYDYSDNPSAGHHRLAVKGLDIDFTNAVSISAWVYIPGDANAYRLYITDSKDADGNKGKNIRTSFINDNEIGSGRKYSQDGWYYITTSIPSLPAGTTPVFIIKANDSYDGTNKYLDWNPYQRGTFYIDDITLNYSSALEDTDPPVFSSVIYNDTNMIDGVELNGQTVNDNCISFRALVAENTSKNNYVGLDTDSIKAYIDGNPTAYTYKDGAIVIKDAILSKGVHTVKFVAADKNGNENYVERKININTDNYSLIFEQEGNATADVLTGAVVWFDLKAQNIEDIQSVSTTIDLDSVNDWEFDGMETLYGFDADYSINERTNSATITFNKVGDVEATGEAVLARIPVRMWRYRYNEISGLPLSNTPSDVDNYQTKAATPYAFWHSDGNRRIAIIIEVKSGIVTLADDTVDTFGSSVITIGSESKYWRDENTNVGGDHAYANKDNLHIHDAQPMEDKPATCTESGYSGRTFCEECNSVVDWGTVIPATGHHYDFVDGVLKCTGCDKLFNGEYTDGKTYVDGVLAQGWIDDCYYVDGEKVTGIVEIDGVYYEFDNDGVSQGVYTGLVQDDQGVYHYSKLGELAGGWFEIEEEWYYFDETTLAPVAEKTFTYPNSKAVTTYQFYENGKIVSGVWVEMDLGTRYYYGPTYYGLVALQGSVRWEEIDGNVYGFNKMGFRYEGICFVKESNNPQELCEFTDEGVYVGRYTGIYEGKYYANGVLAAAGLIRQDGDYYYITKQCSVYTSGTLYLTDALTNGLLPAGNYEFDADGKLVLKNGIIDGFYYVDGTIVKGAGLIEIDGDYYYITQKGSVYVGNGLAVTEANANGLKPAGTYSFDQDGKMIFKEGIVDGYYYENNLIVKGKGLVEVEGDYYFIGQKGQVYVGTNFYVTEEKANGLKPAGKYDFDADGKMIINNGVVDGFYYENGVLVKGAGLVMVGGDFYYITQKGSVYVGNNLSITAAKTNGLMPAGKYSFGTDGKMIDPPVVVIH